MEYGKLNKEELTKIVEKIFNREVKKEVKMINTVFINKKSKQ